MSKEENTSLTTRKEFNEAYENVVNALNAIDEESGKFHNVNPISIMGNTISIVHERDISKLIKLGAYLRDQQAGYAAFVEEEVGLKEYPALDIEGYSIDNIIEDIIKRIKLLSVDERKKRLEKAKSELESLMDKEDKKLKVIENVKSLLNLNDK